MTSSLSDFKNTPDSQKYSGISINKGMSKESGIYKFSQLFDVSSFSQVFTITAYLSDLAGLSVNVKINFNVNIK